MCKLPDNLIGSLYRCCHMYPSSVIDPALLAQSLTEPNTTYQSVYMSVTAVHHVPEVVYDVPGWKGVLTPRAAAAADTVAAMGGTLW